MAIAPVFSVIIPVYNKWELTSACLRSLYEHTPEYDYEVIVVDNASGDATAAELPLLGASLFGTRFRRIRFADNRNFGPACNAGAAAASGPLLFFLNNDTLLTPGWAPPLLKALEDNPRLGGVGPLLLYEDNTVQHLGVVFEPLGVWHLYQGFPSDHPVVRKRRLFQVITAAALLMPADVFRRHEGFYEAYRNGYEDVDLCLRIHATGKRFSCIPESVVYHLESRTEGRADCEDANNTLLFRRCERLFRPDRHIFGQQDDFLPFIHDGFGIGLRMKTEDEQALCRDAAGQPPLYWHTLARANPLWVGGREYLARVLEQQGLGNEALFFLAETARIEMRRTVYARLMRAAAKAGNAEVLELAKEAYEDLAAQNRDRSRAEALLCLVREKGDACLEALYEDALRDAFA